MNDFIKGSEIFDKVLYLGEEEKRDPMIVIRRFFTDYRLHELRETLRTTFDVCITTENLEFSDPAQRGDLMLQFRHLEELLEACLLLKGVTEG